MSNERPVNDYFYTLRNGFTGMVASGGAFGVSFMQNLELGLRIATGFVGLIIGCITLYNLLRKK
jgi:hypothetical protein